MKRKLTRATIDEVRKEMPVLQNNEACNVIGGTKVSSIRINGGYLISYDYENEDLGKLTVYQPDGGGQPIVFDGVTCSNSSAPDGSGFQLGGVVRVGEEPERYFDINLMIHEYGHYLQEESMGTAAYLAYAGSGSLWGRIKDTPYYDIPSEKDASNRGNDYMNTYYPNSGYKAP